MAIAERVMASVSMLEILVIYRTSWPIAFYFITLCCLISCNYVVDVQGKAENDDNIRAPGSSKCGGSGTYYIHEYHVHGEGDGSESDPIIKPMFPTRDDDNEISRDLFNQTRYMEEKEMWLLKFQELNEQLTDERSRRLDIMTRLVSWISRTNKVGPSNVITDGRISVLRNMLAVWSKVEGWNYTQLFLDEAATENITTSDNRDPLELPSEESESTTPSIPTPCAICNLSFLENLQDTIRIQQTEIKSNKKEIQRTHKRYLATYKGYRQMVSNVREIRRDLRTWENRAGRLLSLYENQFSDTKATQAPEKPEKPSGSEQSSTLYDDIKALKRRIWCLEQGSPDPLLCPNIKQRPTYSPPVTSSDDKTQIDDASDLEGLSGQGDTNNSRKYATTSFEDLINGNVSEYLHDSIVDAGKEISSWYQDKLRVRRPKDCSEIDYWFQRRDPVQIIYLNDQEEPVKTLCDEGWNVIMKNIPFGENPLQWEPGVARKWEHYTFGFGTFESDLFWFGNKYIHELTNQADYQLRIDMIRAADNQKVFTEYAFFRLTSEKDGFRLQVGDNMGTAGDILGVHSPLPVDRQPFFTLDKHPDKLDNTLQFYREGWWYPGVDVTHGSEGAPEPCFTHLTHELPWICSPDGYQQVGSVIMKIRPLGDS